MVLNSKDERSINDSLRFIDLLLVLLCEGRTSISKHSAFGTDPSNLFSLILSKFVYLDSSQIFDKAHKCLIDSIRQRDTDALIEAVENATVSLEIVYN
jgi:E3 ubiquitin-protein ligase HECTD1